MTHRNRSCLKAGPAVYKPAAGPTHSITLLLPLPVLHRSLRFRFSQHKHARSKPVHSHLHAPALLLPSLSPPGRLLPVPGPSQTPRRRAAQRSPPPLASEELHAAQHGESAREHGAGADPQSIRRGSCQVRVATGGLRCGGVT